jgi:hypothetical protein
MQHKITTPTPGYTGKVAGIAFADGTATIDDSNDAHRRALAYFRRKGYRVEEVKAEEPAPEPAADEKPPSAAGVPTRGSSKADWLTYVTSEAAGEKRLSVEEAEAKTRDQLAEHVLGPKEG